MFALLDKYRSNLGMQFADRQTSHLPRMAAVENAAAKSKVLGQ